MNDIKFNKQLFQKCLIYLVGAIILSFGIQLVIYTNIGSSPIDALDYYLARIFLQLFKNSDFSGISSAIGIAYLVLSTIITLILITITRNKKLFFVFINIILLSLLIWAWGFLFDSLPPLDIHYLLKLLIAVLAIAILSFGVVLIIITELPAGHTEEIMKLLNNKTKSFFLSKLIIEAIYLTLAFIAMIISIVVLDGNKPEFTQISLFTILNLLLNALFIWLFHKIYKIITKKTLD
ncbi:MAG TPA: hypothetical protein PL120_04025 [Bacilli bacterium]|nr:hypothetical protein [Bacilli bacterium]HPK86039.1 hypothetical protein [Bacilli bacterium]